MRRTNASFACLICANCMSNDCDAKGSKTTLFEGVTLRDGEGDFVNLGDLISRKEKGPVARHFFQFHRCY